MTPRHIRRAHCLFEQSGTFKNEFIKLGIPAEDYDIQDEYGQTDHVIDLFAEIESAYVGGVTCFDSMSCDDVIMAFFPCIYFCANNAVLFKFDTVNYKCKDHQWQIQYMIERSAQRQHFYVLLMKLLAIAERKHLRVIIENPWTQPHYLLNNFPLQPTWIDRNRTLRGDYYVKPTAYWFINIEPTEGLTLQQDKQRKIINLAKRGRAAGICSAERSMISSDYARNFICDKILGVTQPNINKQLTLEI